MSKSARWIASSSIDLRSGPSDLPRQLFINPDLTASDAALCVPECPWEAIYEEIDVPTRFHDDIALNVLASTRNSEFHVPVERLLRGATRDEADENKRRWGILP